MCGKLKTSSYHEPVQAESKLDKRQQVPCANMSIVANGYKTLNYLKLEYHLLTKHAWDEIASDETCQYLPFKLNMFKKISMIGIAFLKTTTHFTLEKNNISS